MGAAEAEVPLRPLQQVAEPVLYGVAVEAGQEAVIVLFQPLLPEATVGHPTPTRLVVEARWGLMDSRHL